MEKTISINLGGALFYAEEDAFRRLDDYLREVERYFSAQGDDSAEIMKDIESSLAEQFVAAGAGEMRRALTIIEVEDALRNMGTVHDFVREEKGEEKEVSGEISENGSVRRFYRDGEDAIVAGVCSGLGHYLGIDPVWIRLVFALSLFLWGFGFWIYVILWVASPTAKTAAQKLAMQGEAVNLSSLSAQLKENLPGAGIKKVGSGAVAAVENFLKRLFGLFGRIFRSVFRLCAFLVALGLIIFSLLAFCTVVFLGVAAIFSGRQYLEPGLAAVIGWPYPWLAASLTLAGSLPFLALFMLGLMITRKNNFLPVAFWLSLLGLWFASFLMFSAIGSATYARVRPYVMEKKSESIALAGEIEKLEISGPYYLQIVPGQVLSLQAEGHPADLADIEASLNDGNLIIGKKPSRDWVCFNCGHSVRLTLSVPPSFKEAWIGDKSVFNLEGWHGDSLSLSFSGASGANISADLKNLQLVLSDMSDVDLVGGNLEKLLIKSDDSANFDSGRAVVCEAEVSLAGMSKISVNAKEKIKAIFETGNSTARLFYNPDLKKLEVEGGSVSQLRFLGEEDNSEMSLMPGSVEVYSVKTVGDGSGSSFTVSGVASPSQANINTVNTGSFKVMDLGNTVRSGAVTITSVEGSSTDIKTAPTSQIRISAPANR